MGLKGTDASRPQLSQVISTAGSISGSILGTGVGAFFSFFLAVLQFLHLLGKSKPRCT